MLASLKLEIDFSLRVVSTSTGPPSINNLYAIYNCIYITVLLV